MDPVAFVPPSSGAAAAVDDRGNGDFSLPERRNDDLRRRPPSSPRMVVFSGGTAFNTVAHELQMNVTASVSHVLPVSDDGGSTAEIVRVLGGPAVGDIRSRCLRLSDESTEESRAVKRLLGHRLVSAETYVRPGGGGGGGRATAEEVRLAAREEWLAIVEGGDGGGGGGGSGTAEGSGVGDGLWSGISTAYKDTIRAFLVHFHVNVLRHATERFDFTGGSVGNFFFAGARIFFRSMSAAIFLYSRVSGIPPESRVLPAVVTEERLTLGAVLEDGTHIRGQHNISHPFRRRQVGGGGGGNDGESVDGRRSKTVIKRASDGNLDDLNPSPISRIAYLFHDRNQPEDWWDDEQRVRPETNPQVIDALRRADCIVYGMGSLYTSVLPTLILDGVGEEVARRKNCPKVLLLNGWHDRETSWRSKDGTVVESMDAAMFVEAVVKALEGGGGGGASRRGSGAPLCAEEEEEEEERDVERQRRPSITDYVTHVLYPRGGEVIVDPQSLERLCESRRGEGNFDRAGGGRTTDGDDSDRVGRILTVEVDSVPADTCAEGSKSGGRSHHRVFEAGSLARALRRLTVVDDR